MSAKPSIRALSRYARSFLYVCNECGVWNECECMLGLLAVGAVFLACCGFAPSRAIIVVVRCSAFVVFSSSLVSVGFSGSRSPSPAAAAALAAVLPLVPAGARLSVGCARGVDCAVRSFFLRSPSLLVFSVASGRFGSGRSAFARRSSRCVLSVAPGVRGLLVALPSAPVPPAGVRPCRAWRSASGSGSWGSVALALGRGRRVALWLPAGVRPPAWSVVSWSSVGAFGSVGCWWLGVAAPVPAQLSLF